MKLSKKLQISIALVWLSFLIIAYAIAQSFLLDSFLRLEQQSMERDLNRVDEALKQFNRSLYTFTSDWSHWDSLYNYILGKNPSFIANNMTMTAYVNAGLNLLTYWDLQGKLIFGVYVDLLTKKNLPFPNDLNKILYPGSPLLARHNVNQDISGLILLNNRIMLIAATAITTGDKTAPPIGAMVNGRYLSTEMLDHLEGITRLNIQVFTANEITENPFLSKTSEKIIAHNGHYEYPINKNTIEGYTIINDINGQPIGFFKITESRAIYHNGVAIIHYYLLSLLVMGVLFSLLMMFLLRVLILKRLEKLDYQIANINAKHNITQRVDTKGNDELSSVASEINAMLSIIQNSQEQLEQRVKDSTNELLQTHIRLQTEKSERQQVEKELSINKESIAQLTRYDSLTNLPNRIFFNELLNKALRHAKHYQQILAIFIIDIDRFKKVNEALGHTIGDRALKEIALRLSTILKPDDVLARLGGDEFIILLNEINQPKYITCTAETIIATCAKPIKLESQEFFLTASIGICIFPNDGITLEDLQRNADMALHKAKRLGGTYQYFTKELNIEAHKSIQLETALRHAINNNEFVLYFQPKLDLASRSITSLEALIRWESPNGSVEPSEFIPLAEETGLIMQIGEWALYQACKINKHWQDLGYQPISVAVNISPKQFLQQDITQLVTKTLKETGLDPKYLEIEITETAVMENVDIAIERLTEINKMGVTVTIDDFGAGYTSIAYLKRFPVKVVKIDQSFIKGIPQNKNDLAITASVIAMAHNLGIKVVAEGVETYEQLQYLAEYQCDMVQGYFISRPLTEKKIIFLFTKNV